MRRIVGDFELNLGVAMLHALVIVDLGDVIVRWSIIGVSRRV